MDITSQLIEALLQRGVRRVYGVPGDYVLGLFDRLERSPIELICMAGEEGAGFAADAHARLTGLGVAVVTYGVGALKLLNPVAGAFGERSPLLVISGAPGLRESDEHALLHHRIRSSDTQERFFKEVCVQTACLDSGRTAVDKILRVLDAMRRESRPGYLELPRDSLTRPVPRPLPPLELPGPIQVSELQRHTGLALLEWLRSRERPVVLAGVEIHRFGLQQQLQQVLEREGWPFATSLSGKSLLSEQHPLYLGVYEGAMGPAPVRQVVEGSDGLLILGMPLSDLDTGVYTMELNAETCLRVEMDRGLQWQQGDQDTLDPMTLLQVWQEAEPPARPASYSSPVRPSPAAAFEPRLDQALTVQRLLLAVDALLTDSTVVLADTGDATFASLALHLKDANDYINSGNWASLGFALPAAVGAWGAHPEQRPLVLVGDGALLMSAIELATLARYRIPALVVVLDNAGYGTERPMLDGPFNDVAPVDHVGLALAMGFRAARRVRLEDELWDCLQTFLQESDGPTLVSVQLDRHDASDALRNLTAALGRKVQAGVRS
ncbi:MAG: thiamine pyrophosphate-binding protein [Synechococcaceae cyanobacterium]|jgi:indolepyruvate decarboxylase|nr:thiamine pyrophosphate-binding protein [Synechococcaceae cyanobacterium]